MGERGIRSGAKHSTGEAVADVEAREAGEDERAPDTPLEEKVVDTERMVQFDQLGFSRMRTEWTGDDRVMMQRIHSTVDGAILNHFEDAYALMYEIYAIVREPEHDDAGEVRTDNFGFVIWQRSVTGAYLEDWARLGDVQREHLIYRLTTSLFEWSQRAASLWTEAMFAKAIWQEKFAKEFDRPVSGTVEHRNAKASMGAAEERYFAVFTAALSRKADAVVRSMELLNQRLKDTSTN